MKTLKYGCDGGCIVIGNGSCRFHIPNSVGDGGYRVFIGAHDEMRVTKYNRDYTQFSRRWKWVGVVEGDAINVYKYDCEHGDDIDEAVLTTLRGRVSIYRHSENGDFLLEVEKR